MTQSMLSLWRLNEGTNHSFNPATNWSFSLPVEVHGRNPWGLGQKEPSGTCSLSILTYSAPEAIPVWIRKYPMYREARMGITLIACLNWRHVRSPHGMCYRSWVSWATKWPNVCYEGSGLSTWNDLPGVHTQGVGQHTVRSPDTIHPLFAGSISSEASIGISGICQVLQIHGFRVLWDSQTNIWGHWRTGS